jgi:hypothetical protein
MAWGRRACRVVVGEGGFVRRRAGQVSPRPVAGLKATFVHALTRARTNQPPVLMMLPCHAQHKAWESLGPWLRLACRVLLFFLM